MEVEHNEYNDKSTQRKATSKTNKHKPTITVSFGFSTSNNYNLAVERAKAYPTYKATGEGKEVIHSVDFAFDEIDDLRSLLDLVGQWKSTTLYVDNKPVAFSEISAVLYCYHERQHAYDPKEYCYGRDDANSYNDNDFGCRHCGVNPYAWNGLAGFGQMQKDGTFVVDKEKLTFTVEKNLNRYMLCPALDIQKIKNKIEAFPDAINPQKNRQWEYVTEWNDEKEIAIAVKKKDPRLKSGYTLKDNTLEDNYNYYQDVNSIKKAKAGSGCLLPILMAIAIFILAVCILAF